MALSASLFSSMSFDYLIAGGGTAGLTMAARLIENASVQVGVIEAGASHIDDPKVLTPADVIFLLGKPEYDWLYNSTPQADASGRYIAQSRGKGLGGSSAINSQFLTFASRNDIDDWEALGNEGWSYDDLVPYYKKFEDYQPPPSDVAEEASADYINASAHGYGGPIRGSFAPFYTDLQKAWTPTYRNLGIGADGDMRDGVALGGYTNLMSQNQEDHTRSYAGNRYYEPNARKPNLKVLTEARVNNIIFNKKKKDGLLVATGLNFTVNGTHYIVNVKKEVIISAGTIESPKLLELSGIGNPDILKEHDIPILLENKAIGENLQDHPVIGNINQVNEGVITQDQYLFNKSYNDDARKLYETNHTGPLTSLGTQYAPLSWSQILPTDQKSRPQDLVAKYLAPGTYTNTNSPPGLAEQYSLVARRLVDPHEAVVCDGMYAGIGSVIPNPSTNRFDLVYRTSFIAHALSRGYVHINSSDPTEPPTYNPRYLSHPLDVLLLADVALHQQRVGQAPPLSTLFAGNGTVYGAEYPDGVNVTNVDGYVRKLVTTGWHPIGTCAMMPRGKGGVVNPRLKVYGTANVRVVDASVAPLHVRGNLQSLVYALAEYAADIVKADQEPGRESKRRG